MTRRKRQRRSRRRTYRSKRRGGVSTRGIKRELPKNALPQQKRARVQKIPSPMPSPIPTSNEENELLSDFSLTPSPSPPYNGENEESQFRQLASQVHFNNPNSFAQGMPPPPIESPIHEDVLEALRQSSPPIMTSPMQSPPPKPRKPSKTKPLLGPPSTKLSSNWYEYFLNNNYSEQNKPYIRDILIDSTQPTRMIEDGFYDILVMDATHYAVKFRDLSNILAYFADNVPISSVPKSEMSTHLHQYGKVVIDRKYASFYSKRFNKKYSANVPISWIIDKKNTIYGIDTRTRFGRPVSEV